MRKAQMLNRKGERVAASLNDAIPPERLLTSHEVGALLQCNPSSVNKWVKEERIPAHRTPGGHRRIRASDLLAFLVKHGMPVPPKMQGLDGGRPVVTDQALELLVEVGVPPAMLTQIKRRSRREP